MKSQQKKMKVDLNELDINYDGEVELFYLNNKLYSGDVYELFDGKIASEFEVENGVKQGCESLYNPNGSLHSTYTYRNGLLCGETKCYYETGELQEEALFEFGICLWHKLYSAGGELVEERKLEPGSPEHNLLEACRKSETGD